MYGDAVVWLRRVAPALLALASACAPYVRSEKVDPAARPVEALAVSVKLGHLGGTNLPVSTKQAYVSEFARAMQTRLPAILERNGVPVSAVDVQAGAFGQKFLNPRSGIPPSHRLELIAAQHVGGSNANYVQFEAELVDIKANRVVWKGLPQMGVVEKQPLIRTELVARDLLFALNRDGLIKLSGDPLDLHGNPITVHAIWAEDR